MKLRSRSSSEPGEHGERSEPQAQRYRADLLPVEMGVRGDAVRAGPKVQGAVEGKREAQEARGRSDPGQCDSQGGDPGKLLSPSRRQKAVRWVCESLRISQRRGCRVLGQARSTQRQERGVAGEEERLVARIISLATRYGQYGYRRMTALLRAEGWRVNHKRVERMIWRQERLKVPQKQPKRGRLWLNDGSCIRLRPERRNHVWSYDLMAARIQDGRTFRILTLLDEYTKNV